MSKNLFDKNIDGNKNNTFNARKLTEELLLELNRNQLISKSKKSDKYKTAGRENENRWTRRNKSTIATRVDQYNKIDMNELFKNDELKVGINVHGETNDYVVLIRYNGVLHEVAEQIKRNNNKLEFKCILIALQRVFNNGNVFVSCSCLHPETKIKLLDGTSPTVEELKKRFDNGETLWAYSTDENGDFKPGQIKNVWITKTTTDFIETTLDNGEKILTTPEHPFMLRSGEYIQAKDLKENDSLMPLYFSQVNGYETVKFNTEERGWHTTYKVVANELKQKEIAEKEELAKTDGSDKFSYSVAIHHKDFNKQNNTPENLLPLTSYEHWSYHANLCGANRPITENMREVSRENAKKRNANPTPAMIEQRNNFVNAGRLRNNDEDRKAYQREVMLSMRKQHPELYTTEALSKRSLKAIEDHPELKEQISNRQKAVWANYSPEEYAKRCATNKASNERTREIRSNKAKEIWSNRTEETKKEIARKCSEKLKGRKLQPFSAEHKANISKAAKERSPEEKQRIISTTRRTKILKVLQYLIDNKLSLTEDNYLLAVKEFAKNNSHVYMPSFKAEFKTIDEAVAFFKLNHKVKAARVVTLENTPVYDLTVDTWGNFLLDAGVVVHNCPDWAYRQAYNASKGGYNSGPLEIRASDITNPGDTKGAGCKHVNLVLGNIDWLMKVTSVINNYIHYMKRFYERKYADLIFPKLFNMPYQKAVQLNLFDTDDSLVNDDDEIKLSNRFGRDRGKFRSDVQVNNMKNFGKEPQIKDNPNQPKLELNLTRKEDEIKKTLQNNENNAANEMEKNADVKTYNK